MLCTANAPGGPSGEVVLFGCDFGVEGRVEEQGSRLRIDVDSHVRVHHSLRVNCGICVNGEGKDESWGAHSSGLGKKTCAPGVLCRGFRCVTSCRSQQELAAGARYSEAVTPGSSGSAKQMRRGHPRALPSLTARIEKDAFQFEIKDCCRRKPLRVSYSQEIIYIANAIAT